MRLQLTGDPRISRSQDDVHGPIYFNTAPLQRVLDSDPPSLHVVKTLLSTILQDKDKYRRLLTLPGDLIQASLDVIQRVGAYLCNRNVVRQTNDQFSLSIAIS